ncbi:NUDIX hydrolase N-terminal domain-containing protein [Longispora urticae]
MSSSAAGSTETTTDVASARWARFAARLHALAQQNLLYADSDFARERNSEVLDIVAEMIADGAGAPVAEVRPFLGVELGWPTPKVDVRAVIFNDAGELLLCRESDGCWSVPGGYQGVDESIAAAVVREVAEEVGLTVTATRILGVFDRSRRAEHQPPFPYGVNIVFVGCDRKSGEAAASKGVGSYGEIKEVGWFAPSDLPADLSVTRVIRDELVAVCAVHADPTAPTVFD